MNYYWGNKQQELFNQSNKKEKWRKRNKDGGIKMGI